ncbi:hypothetical protein M2266_004644 [Streptomyces sp. SPB162]|nr:hypothetical protein [Streptomyces sp. SPB162]
MPTPPTTRLSRAPRRKQPHQPAREAQRPAPLPGAQRQGPPLPPAKERSDADAPLRTARTPARTPATTAPAAHPREAQRPAPLPGAQRQGPPLPPVKERSDADAPLRTAQPGPPTHPHLPAAPSREAQRPAPLPGAQRQGPPLPPVKERSDADAPLRTARTPA